MSKITECNDKNGAFCVSVPNNLLDAWYCTRNGCGRSFVEQLNGSITSKAIMIKPGCGSAEEKIRVRACLVHKKMKNLSHHKKYEMSKRSSKILLYANEMNDVCLLNKCR